jgi:hypothetical protein
MRWNGKELTSPDSTRPALNGEYTWEVVARPDDGIGPELRATGRFAVTRPVAVHDYDDNGTPDVFVRDPWGGLARVGMQPSAAGDNVVHEGAWNVGGGWQVYDQLAGGSDLTNDGRADVLATDRSGVLWLYSGTGNVKAPFSVRKKIGGGWGIYNQLTAAGNLAGAAAGDLVARVKGGVLWLYLGKGDGTFATRTKFGAGWNTYRDLIGIGDGNGDGRADLLALKQGTSTGSYFYAGTGDWRAPFKGAKGNAVLLDDLFYETGF